MCQHKKPFDHCAQQKNSPYDGLPKLLPRRENQVRRENLQESHRRLELRISLVQSKIHGRKLASKRLERSI